MGMDDARDVTAMMMEDAVVTIGDFDGNEMETEHLNV